MSNKPTRSKKLTRFAKGRDCTLRIPHVCSFDPEKTMMVHPPIANGGMSTKASDLECAIGCHDCHNRVARLIRDVEWVEVLDCWIRGSAETRALLVEAGIVEVK